MNPLPRNPYFVKFDLSEAFYHITVHPASRRITTFELDGTYYRFVRLPFGIGVAPFTCQMLLNAFARHLRSLSLWAWGHVDNKLLAHPDPTFLMWIYTAFLADLTRCGFRLNPNDTTYEPSQTIQFLGFNLHGHSMTIAHLPSRVDLVHRLLYHLPPDLPLPRLRRGPVSSLSISAYTALVSLCSVPFTTSSTFILLFLSAGLLRPPHLAPLAS